MCSQTIKTNNSSHKIDLFLEKYEWDQTGHLQQWSVFSIFIEQILGRLFLIPF